jgi:hypothetical protein
VDEVFRKQDTSGLGHRNRRSSEVLKEQPPQLAFSNSKPLSESVNAFALTV